MLSAGDVRMAVKNICGEVAPDTRDTQCTEPVTTQIQGHVDQLQGGDTVSQFALDSYFAFVNEAVDTPCCADGKVDELETAGGQCVRDEYIRPGSTIIDGINQAFQRASAIRQGSYAIKEPTSPDAQVARTIFAGADSPAQANFDNLYKRATATLTGDQLATFDSILRGAAFERYLSGPQTVVFSYRGRVFETLDELMIHASVVAQGLSDGTVTVESLGLPRSLILALEKIWHSDYKASDSDKREITDLASAMYHEAVADIVPPSQKVAASEFYGDAVARLVTGTLAVERAKTDNTVEKEVAALRTALSTQYLVLGRNSSGQNEAQLAKFPDALVTNSAIGLAANAATPANLNIGLRRLWFEARKTTLQEDKDGKIANALAAAVKNMEITDAGKLAERLSYYRVDKAVKNPDGSFAVTLAIATETPEWLRLTLGITDGPRTVALDYVWNQIATGKLPEGKTANDYMQDLSKKLKPYARGANSLLRVIITSLNPDGSLTIALMPRSVHEQGGRSIFDMRNNDAVAAALFNRQASELYLKARAAKQGFDDDDNASMDSETTAAEVSRALVTALKAGGAEPYAIEFKEWKDGKPVFGKKEEPKKPFTGKITPQFIFRDGNDTNAVAAIRVDGHVERHFGAEANETGQVADVSVDISGGSSLKEKTDIPQGLPFSPPPEPTGKITSASPNGLSAIGGYNWVDSDREHSGGPFGGLQFADNFLAAVFNLKFNWLDEKGESKLTLKLSNSFGRVTSFLADTPFVDKFGGQHLKFDNWAYAIAPSLRWVQSEFLTLAASVTYRANLGSNPNEVTPSLALENFSIPKTKLGDNWENIAGRASYESNFILGGSQVHNLSFDMNWAYHLGGKDSPWTLKLLLGALAVIASDATVQNDPENLQDGGVRICGEEECPDDNENVLVSERTTSGLRGRIAPGLGLGWQLYKSDDLTITAKFEERVPLYLTGYDDVVASETTANLVFDF